MNPHLIISKKVFWRNFTPPHISNEIWTLAQIDESGQVYGSITLDVLNGIDQSEVYEFNGSIKDKKIGGKGPYEDGFEVYFKLEPIDSSD